MYCTSCGAERADRATVCGQCGQRVAYFPPPDTVPNHLVQAIVVTLFCCLPLGIVALIYSARVNTQLAAGNIAGARLASNRARTWIIVTFVVGILSVFGIGALTYLSR